MAISILVLSRLFGVLLLWALPLTSAWPEIRVTDDAGNPLVLERPAQRIVSLAPHITELLFAAGAGAAVVGVSEYSDYPVAADGLPRVSGGNGLDLEAILGLRPDLVIAWQSGNPVHQVSRLRQLGLRVFVSEPRHLEDIVTSLERFGRLAGSPGQAREQAGAFRQRHAGLARRYAEQDRVSVFYSVWQQPLMTVNGEHLISDVIRLCGGRNVFEALPGLAPQIGIEAVLVADPQAIITGGGREELSELYAMWAPWPELTAVKDRHLFTVPRDFIVRPTPRVLDGAERLCHLLESVRRKINGVRLD
ncbi:MAG: cobalamin-binding protein [Gammaproteobacteria bacterium]|nr:cobalamin-binding protein [Gammaproteobacteria bacterium]